VTAQNSQPRVLIAQISDLHVKPEGALAYRRVDTARALARCVKELNRFTPRPHLVVISGDLVDIPSKEAYDHRSARDSSPLRGLVVPATKRSRSSLIHSGGTPWLVASLPLCGAQKC